MYIDQYTLTSYRCSRSTDGENSNDGAAAIIIDPMVAVSVAICTHNPRRDYLRRALAALEAQTLARDRWELVMVDNASTDDSVARVNSYRSLYSPTFRRHSI